MSRFFDKFLGRNCNLNKICEDEIPSRPSFADLIKSRETISTISLNENAAIIKIGDLKYENGKLTLPLANEQLEAARRNIYDVFGIANKHLSSPAESYKNDIEIVIKLRGAFPCQIREVDLSADCPTQTVTYNTDYLEVIYVKITPNDYK